MVKLCCVGGSARARGGAGGKVAQVLCHRPRDRTEWAQGGAYVAVALPACVGLSV